MIETENSAQALAHGYVLTFEHDDDSMWLEIRSTITGDREAMVEVPASELRDLAKWMLRRAPVPGIKLPPASSSAQYCGRGLCAQLEGHEGKCAT